MNFYRIDRLSEFEELIREINATREYCVFDTETTGLNVRKAAIVDIQLSGLKQGDVYFVPGRFAPCLKKISVTQVWQNFKYDWQVLHHNGVDMRPHVPYSKLHDTMHLWHLVDERKDVSKSVANYVATYHKGEDFKDFWELYDNYLDASEETRFTYACKDIYYTEKMYLWLKDQLRREDIKKSLVEHVHRLALSLYDTEVRGVGLDLEYLINRGVELKTKIEAVKPRLRAACLSEVETIEYETWDVEIAKRKTQKGKDRVPKPEFSFDSNPQVTKLLYGKIGLPPQKDEKTKNLTVGDAALVELEDMHPVVPLIREYREHQKIYGTYIQGTLELKDGNRIYPEFNVSGTVTGRISHKNPNMGNMPKVGGIRGMFVPDAGNVIISSDMAQLEVVIEAHYTQDKNLLKIVYEGASKHDITAEGLGISRDLAKTINFAMQYGCGPAKVARILGIPENEGKAPYEQYWKVYKGVTDLRQKVNKWVDNGRPIVNLFGRKRRFDRRPRKFWDGDYRSAYSALIQGTGGDLTSQSFYLIDEWLKERGYGHGLWTVHDECLIEVKSEFAEEAEAKLIFFMSEVGKLNGLSVPLKAQGSGPMLRWED